MSTSTLVYPLKRGATLSLGGYKTLGAGNWSGTAQVRKIPASGSTEPGELVDDLAVTLTDPVDPETRHFVLVEGGSDLTVDWPLEKLQIDIRFADDGSPPVVLPTETFVINVKREITDAG